MTFAAKDFDQLFLRDMDGVWWVGHGPFERTVQPSPSKPSFLRKSFYADEDPRPWWIPQLVTRHKDLDWVNDLLRSPDSSRECRQNSTEFGASNFRRPDWELFKSDFAAIQSEIESGTIKKAVLTTRSTAEGVPSTAAQLKWLQHLSESPSKLLVYGGFGRGFGFMGRTPEILCSWLPHLVETMALAGTAPVDGLSLLQSEKDRFEHDLVIEDITERLSGLGELGRAETKEWRLGPLKHLRTDLGLKAHVDFGQVVDRLHPTAALGGLPRVHALNVLRRLRASDEIRYFGSAFGVYEPEKFGFSVVMIRQVQWGDGQTHVPIGCGIVAASRLENEWQEILLKRRAVFQAFGIQGEAL